MVRLIVNQHAFSERHADKGSCSLEDLALRLDNSEHG